jgi:hypothetical protein
MRACILAWPSSPPPSRLPNGLLFGLPVVMDTSNDAIKPGAKLMLTYKGQVGRNGGGVCMGEGSRLCLGSQALNAESTAVGHKRSWLPVLHSYLVGFGAAAGLLPALCGAGCEPPALHPQPPPTPPRRRWPSWMSSLGGSPTRLWRRSSATAPPRWSTRRRTWWPRSGGATTWGERSPALSCPSGARWAWHREAARG